MTRRSRNITGAADPRSPLELILTDMLRDTVQLPDAACVGRGELFDPMSEGESREDVDERHRTAVRLCWECPAIGPCRDWSIGEPASDGVLAGRLPEFRRPPGRPRSNDVA
ncbi:WhiB family transcriptional regulator [Rhodococcus sp. IEGM 1330]|uniref:WhiB family transcriptional regulator n=1 Tax=Rhodococcus sp. IEGM 1330 TaxID=3082225 RepID=UPI002953375D|nr:WhiB family transcriptional regulator [Rhodococcus sp. IEGM 1330]MDV8024003.1 WhiB family transcriptional regulator [Rhodococcus sp. IEGM 1330]